MASSLPPPGASRPRPPLAPPTPGSEPVDLDDEPLAEAASEAASTTALETADPSEPDVAQPDPVVAERPDPPAVAPLPPPRADTAWPSQADEDRERGWRHQRWILSLGFIAVGIALGTVSYSAWLVSAPQAWVVWVAIAVVPAGLTALAAVLGTRLARPLAVVTTIAYFLLAIVALIDQPAVGLPLLVCAIAAAAVTVAGRGIRADASRHGAEEEPAEPSDPAGAGGIGAGAPAG